MQQRQVAISLSDPVSEAKRDSIPLGGDSPLVGAPTFAEGCPPKPISSETLTKEDRRRRAYLNASFASVGKPQSITIFPLERSCM